MELRHVSKFMPYSPAIAVGTAMIAAQAEILACPRSAGQLDLREVRGEDAREQVPEARDLVDDTEEVVVHVAEIRPDVLVQDLVAAAARLVEWLEERPDCLVELQHFALELVDALGRVGAGLGKTSSSTSRTSWSIPATTGA